MTAMAWLGDLTAAGLVLVTVIVGFLAAGCRGPDCDGWVLLPVNSRPSMYDAPIQHASKSGEEALTQGSWTVVRRGSILGLVSRGGC